MLVCLQTSLLGVLAQLSMSPLKEDCGQGEDARETLEGPPTALESSVFLCVGDKDLVFGSKLDKILSELAEDDETMLLLVGVTNVEMGRVVLDVACSSSVSSRHLTISLKARVSCSSSMLLVSVIVWG
jgi:hypothetical protein